MKIVHPLRWKRVFLAILAFGLWGFVVYVNWFAAPEDLRAIGARQLDKIAHFAGGVFLAAFAEWIAPRTSPLRLLSGFFVVAVGWEATEFAFDPGTRHFHAAFPSLWLLDSTGDIFAALCGAAFWRRYFKT